MRNAKYLVILLITLFLASFAKAQPTTTDSSGQQRQLKLSIPTKTISFLSIIDFNKIANLNGDPRKTNIDNTPNNTTAQKKEEVVEPILQTKIDSSLIKSLSYLQKYYNQPSQTKHDSIIQSSLGLLLEIATYENVRQQYESAKKLLESTSIELKINTLNNYLDTLQLLKREYNFFRETSLNVDSVISINDSIGLSSMDSNFVDQLSLMLDQTDDLDTKPENVSIDSLITEFYIPDSLILSIEEFIKGIKKDSLIDWITKMQNDTIDLYLVDINKDSVKIRLYQNSPEVIHLSITDVWGNKIPAILRDIQKESFKLVVDESAEIVQVSIDKSKKDLRKYSFLEVEGIGTLQKRKVPKFIKPWSFYGNSNINISQIAFHQWTLGGESSISVLFGTELWWKYRKDKHSWNNYSRIKIGAIRQGDYDDKSAPIKPNEDNLDYITHYNYNIKPNLYASFMVNLKTRVLKSSYDHTDTVLQSNFFSPAYLTFSLGTEYKVNKTNVIFLAPLSLKSTIVLDPLVDQTKFGLSENETMRKEMGLNIIFTNNLKVWDNIKLISSLELFSNYLHNPQNIDVNWQFELKMPINNYIESKISWSFIYDDDETVPKKNDDGTTYDSKGGQFKENISVGFLIKF